MNLADATKYAAHIAELLATHCERIQIAGSIRRMKPDNIKDVEIVAIPRPYDTGLFQSGIAEVLEGEEWSTVKGQLAYGVCRYTQRWYQAPGWTEPVKVDIFFARPENWGLILAIRTGSAEWAHQVLARQWVKKGYRSEGGMLKHGDREFIVREERDLFQRIGLAWVEPQNRNV